MNSRFEKLVSIFFVALLALSGLMITVRPVSAAPTAVSVVPSPLEFGPADCVGQEFTITVEITDVTDLYGIDIKFAWDPEYLAYVSHTAHIPVEDYPDGVLHEPGMFIKDDVDDVAGTYWVAYSSMAPAEPFDGSGIAFEMTFRIVKQPMAPDPDVTIVLDLVSTDLANSGGSPITHERNDGTVIIHSKPFSYPPEPLLKILPESVSGLPVGSTFESDVHLLGINISTGEEEDLSPFWDIAGFDMYIRFKRPTPPYVIIDALDVTIDPDGWFAGFWPGGILEVEKTINNAEGWVHVVFLGIPGANGTHTAPYGQGRIVSLTFNASYKADTYPPPTVEITLKNPRTFVHRMEMDADVGLIDLTNPVGTSWTAINSYDYGSPYTLDGWVDKDVDGELSIGDELVLTDTVGGRTLTYVMKDLKGTLTMTMQPFPATEEYIWAADFPDVALENCGLPGRATGGGTAAAYNGFGNPYWTGNFTLQYPFSSVASITVHALPFTPDEYTYTLTEGVDYIVYPDDDKIELLTPLDVDIINECWSTDNNTLGGWPAINYVASGIQSVYRRFPEYHPYYEETEGFAANLGFEQPPPAEWWYEPEWPWELEGWWALGYFTGDYNWPEGTIWWINYTAASYMTVEYFAEPDPRPYYVEFDGSYEDFLALGDPVGTTWNEVYPSTLNVWTCTGWTDADSSGDVTVGDTLTLESGIGVRDFVIDHVATDMTVDQVFTICDEDPSHPYFGREPIVQVAGFPHPDYPWCPWHGSDSSPPLPHQVKSATYEAYFRPPGGMIDVYTQYPNPYGGQGLYAPSDMFWPQQEVILFANVTYSDWPEQNKDVSFEVKDPHMNVWGIFYARTNEYGVAWVSFRLPWPCDDPDYYRGEWHVYATVDVAGKTVNDTLNFKYDYLVNIWKVTTDKDSYAHCEDITITIDYGSYAMQEYNVIITVTITDETGVPFGYAYVEVTIGGAEYCTYNNDAETLTIHVAKFARPGVAKIWVGALNGFPQNGGTAISPLYEPVPEIYIEAEWA